MQIYLVMANMDYETTSVIRAFQNKEDAEEFEKACNVYTALREKMPRDSMLFEAWDNKDREYRLKHPAGGDAASAEGFYVIPIEYIQETAGYMCSINSSTCVAWRAPKCVGGPEACMHRCVSIINKEL